jgi:hypothetical protein
MRRTLETIVVFCSLLVFAAPSFAQNFGQFTGIVADTTGGVLVGASVTVTNTQTGATVTQQANTAGVYVFPNLLPGVYNIKVEMDGFRSTLRNRVELQIQQTVRLDFRLEIGSLNETVEATAVAPMLNSEDAVIGTVIENRRIVELPLNGRNFLKMVELTPTCRPALPTQALRRRVRVAIDPRSSCRSAAAGASGTISRWTASTIPT